MKIGILTFHMAHNFGAMLQAYALCSTVEKFNNCTCQVIDYRLPEIYDKYDALLKKKVVEPKRLKFEEFMHRWLPLSPRITDVHKAKKYELYIVGSDQIWNPMITGGFRDEYFGKMFPKESYKVSYGASTGIFIEDWGELASKLDEFNQIGVRETWCVEKLSKYLDKEIVCCLDPVFLLERREWIELSEKKRFEKYILIYAFELSENEYKEIEAKARDGAYTIIEIVTHHREKRRDIIYDINCGPEDFLGYINNAEYIYTDSYHGILFSIIFRRKFIYLSRGEKNNARVNDILERLELQKNKGGFFKMSKHEIHILQKYRNESLIFVKESIQRGDN